MDYIFFIPWVLLILFCVLAVPIASVLDKGKMQSSYEGYDGGGMDDESLEPMEPLDDSQGAILEEGNIQQGAQDPNDPFGTGASDDLGEFADEFN